MNPAAAGAGAEARRDQGRDAGPLADGGRGSSSIRFDTGALAGLRDPALLSVMLYSFARVSAVLGMRRQDYFGQGSRGWLRLHEKGGKRHDVPAHHRAAAALDAYVEVAELEGDLVGLDAAAAPARLVAGGKDRGEVRRPERPRLPPASIANSSGVPVFATDQSGADSRRVLVTRLLLSPPAPRPATAWTHAGAR